MFSVAEAENYSEMIAEYMTIIVSVCIYAASRRQLSPNVVYLALLQIAIELVVDWLCLYVEQRLGMPLPSTIQSQKGFRSVMSLIAMLGVAVTVVSLYIATDQVFIDLLNTTAHNKP